MDGSRPTDKESVFITLKESQDSVFKHFDVEKI
jgi:hypothetical protein